jgi:uridine phosphorylase
METKEHKHLGITNTEIPIDAEGRTMHVAVNGDEMSNRIITVGDYGRAETISKHFDDPSKTIVVKAKRGFHSYTGLYHGVPVTVVGTGMGLSMIDFLVREARQVVDGPIAMVRFGTCGIVNKDIKAGDIIIPSEGSICIQENYDFEPAKDPTEKAYHISKVSLPNKELSELLVTNFKKITKEENIKRGIDASADSFYSSQGRVDLNFKEYNKGLIELATVKYPNLSILEMETHVLFTLAERSVPGKKIYASCACIGLFERLTKKIVGEERVKFLESEGGKMVLESMVQMKFPEGEPENSKRLIELISKKH